MSLICPGGQTEEVRISCTHGIGDLDRFDRFAVPAKLWGDLQRTYSDLLAAG